MVSKGRQRERDLEAARRVTQGPVVYVEGGAKGELARTAARAFGVLFEQLHLPLSPKIIACGGRRATYDRFAEHVGTKPGEAVLLVDSEEVRRLEHWAHVARRVGDKWERPPGAGELDLCFMAVVMETWCLTPWDRKKDLEKVEKREIYKLLERATKGRWTSRHKAASFEWLERVDASELRRRCPEFERIAMRLGAWEPLSSAESR